MQIFFGSQLRYRYKLLLVMFVTTTRLSFFACQKGAAGAAVKRWLRLSAPANKKSAPASP